MVKANVGAGIATDTVLATATGASTGSWQTLTGTTIAITDMCILEFYVDCDGTQGWINIDDWSSTTVNDTQELGYALNGFPFAAGNNESGGGGQVSFAFAT